MTDLLNTGGNVLYYTGRGAANLVYMGATGLYYGYKWFYPDPTVNKEKILKWRVVELEDKLYAQEEMIKKINRRLLKDGVTAKKTKTVKITKKPKKTIKLRKPLKLKRSQSF